MYIENFLGEDRMKYRFLLFDADDTLLDFEAAERDGLTKMFSDLGLTLDEGMRQRYAVLNKGLWKLLDEGKLTRDELLYTRFGTFFKQEGIDADGVLAENTYRKHLSEGHETVEGARELLKDLGKRYEIYVATNGLAETQIRRMRESGLDRLVRETFISEQIGANKPEKAFFDYVESHIPNFDRTQALLIGDSLSSDIQGGINAGIDTCWFDRENRTCPEDPHPTYKITELKQLYDILQEEKPC